MDSDLVVFDQPAVEAKYEVPQICYADFATFRGDPRTASRASRR